MSRGRLPGVTVATPELTLLADAAQAFVAAPPEERAALRDDVVAFLREQLERQQRLDWGPAIDEIAEADLGQPALVPALLLRLCAQLSKAQ